MNTPDYENATWVKSSYSGSTNECVEVAILQGGILAVRDSKNAAGPVLEFSADEWTAFLNGAHVLALGN